MAYKYVTENDLDLHCRSEFRAQLASTSEWELTELSVISMAKTYLSKRFDIDVIFADVDPELNSDLAYQICAIMVYRMVKRESPAALSDGMRDENTAAKSWFDRASLAPDHEESITPSLTKKDQEEYPYSRIRSQAKTRSESL